MNNTSNLIAIFTIRFTGVLLSFLLNIYFTRVLEKEILGYYFWLIQLLMVGSVLLKGGIDLSALKYGGIISNKETKSIITKYSFYALLPAIVIIFITITASKIYSKPDFFSATLFISLCIIPFSLFNIIAELLKARNKQISAAVIQACLLPIFIFVTFNITSLSLINSYILSIVFLMFVSILWITYDIFTQEHSHKSATHKERHFWLDSRAFLVIAILNVIMNSMDLLMLGALEGSTVVAEYGIANKLVALSSILLIVVNGIIGPKFSALWENKQKEELKRLFMRVTFMMLSTSIAMLLFFVFAGEITLTTLYGSQYKSSYELLVVLAFGQAVVLGTGPVAYLLMMTNSKNAYKKSLFLAVITNFILNLIFIPTFGALGAAIATAIGLIVKNIYGLIIANRQYNFIELGAK